MLAFSSGYRQVALTTNKHRIVQALKRKLPVCLFSVVECLAVLDEKRTRAKSSDFLYVLIQAVRTERTRGLKTRGACLTVKILICRNSAGKRQIVMRS